MREQRLGDYSRGGNMCLSTIYTVLGDEQEEIMKDVARIEAEGGGFWAIDLFGERTFIEGTIRNVDLLGGTVMIDKSNPNG
jgi:predicted RNA-binding protein